MPDTCECDYIITSRARETGKATVRDSARAEEWPLTEITVAAAIPKTVLPTLVIKVASFFNAAGLKLPSLDCFLQRALKQQRDREEEWKTELL